MRIIKRLDMYVLKNFTVLFAGTFCISLFAVMMQFLWKYVDELVGKGLGVDVIGRFFFYAAESLVPLALPLAVLLASLISFGNMGERLELLAIKAAGISLIRTMMPVAVFIVMVSLVSLYFQNVVGPQAEAKIIQYRISMMKKSPELDIPEGAFYDGIDGINLFVKKKNPDTGMLYGVVIYNLRDGIQDAHIILSDSAKLKTSADKRFLTLHLYSGEQFENLQGGMLKTQYSPYRRETFVEKNFIIDFDMNLNMEGSDTGANNAKTKNMVQLIHDIDSMQVEVDSMSHAVYNDMMRGPLYVNNPANGIADSTEKAQYRERIAKLPLPDIDTLFARAGVTGQQNVVRGALSKVEQVQMSLDIYAASWIKSQDKNIRRHWLKYWQKITMSLTCLLFFFIGAPLGAIIRKGGLGAPVVVSVVIFIIYYILDTGATNMALEDTIPAWIGSWASMIVLTPLAFFLTIKSNNDSVVFNIDSYRAVIRKVLGIRAKRNIFKKEVIINDPDYPAVCERLRILVDDCREYLRHYRRMLPHSLLIHIIRNRRDESLARICGELDDIVEELSNSKDREVFHYLNRIPVISREPRHHNRLKKELPATMDSCRHLIDFINKKNL